MIPIGSHPSWHPVFETLAYAAGYAVFKRLRAQQGDVVAEPQRWTVLAAAAVGALVGSRVLGLAEQWPTVEAAWRTGNLLRMVASPGGKTIVGGLLGGWLGVEIVKRISGIHRRTGDLFALPLCVGIAVGRIGCLIAGLADDTYGKPTTLPWAVDLGDGIGRHPVQVYEIVFLILLGMIVSKSPLPVFPASMEETDGPLLPEGVSTLAQDKSAAADAVLGVRTTKAPSSRRDDAKSAMYSLDRMKFLSRTKFPEGARFRIFLGSYLAWRLAIDFLKPQPLIHGLNLIQWSCLAGILVLMLDWVRGWRREHGDL